MNKSERRARAKTSLTMVGLDEDRLDRFPHELSGGQRQRIMIALALALDPELVIMDEPTTALDVVTQREIINELLDLRTQLNFAMIFITHDLSLLVELADEIVVMYAGSIVERARAERALRSASPPLHAGALELLSPDDAERVANWSGSPARRPTSADLPVGCTFHAALSLRDGPLPSRRSTARRHCPGRAARWPVGCMAVDPACTSPSNSSSRCASPSRSWRRP